MNTPRGQGAADRPARAVIIRAAADLFGEKGYHGTSVRDISSEVGIEAGSLYSHIESKQQILAEILRAYSAQAHAVLVPLETASLSTRDKLRAVFATYFRLISESPSTARVAVHDARSLEPEAFEEARQRRRTTQAIVSRIVQHGIDIGEIREINTTLVSMAVFSISNWAVEWYDPAGKIEPDEAAAFFADLLLDGLAAPPDRRSRGARNPGGARPSRTQPPR